MKFSLILLFFWISFPVFAFNHIVVISDLDDTIRQVNVAQLEKATVNVVAARAHLKTIPRFLGLQKVYTDLKENHNTSFYYLSASYPIIYDAKAWLKHNDFPSGEVRQRAYRDEFHSSAFKKRMLSEIVQKHNSPETLFLFFGDNGEHDPESYNHTVEEFQLESNSMIFIRDVVTDATFSYPDSRNLWENTNYFLTEKFLLKTDLAKYISNETVQMLEKQNHNDIPHFMKDNLDERYEDNVCDPISSYRFIAKLYCSKISGNIANQKIKDLFKED